MKIDNISQNSIDISKRKITNINNIEFIFYYNSFLSDSIIVSRLITNFIKIKDEITIYNLEDKIINNCIGEKIEITEDNNKMIDSLFNGDFIITNNYNNKMFIIDAKSYPSRSLSEPDSERVVRGSRDGFNENLITNLALIRRRIKNENLCIKIYEIGTYSKTKVALVYLKDQINQKYLKNVCDRLEKIKVKELTMSDKALEELLVDKKYSLYPLVKYTERPDTLAIHLYQGMFGIIVDTSPSAIIGPISLFDHLQHAEEFRQSIVPGSYLRLIRFIGIVIAFLSIPLWYALIDYDLPGIFNVLSCVNKNRNFIFLQLLIVLVGIELIRMASIHTPSALSTSMGLVAGLIIGDVAIKVGLFSEQIVILAAISSIGSYITPSYELSLSNKMANLLLLVVTYIFRLPGFIIGLLLLIIMLSLSKSFGKPYLYPLIPFSFKGLLKQMIRIPYQIKEETNKSK